MTTNKVCYTEALGAAPCVRLGCGHLTHFHCARDKIEAGYSSTRISFAFMECALCREAMSHPALAEQLSPHQALASDVTRMALERLRFDHLEGDIA